MSRDCSEMRPRTAGSRAAVDAAQRASAKVFIALQVQAGQSAQGRPRQDGAGGGERGRTGQQGGRSLEGSRTERVGASQS